MTISYLEKPNTREEVDETLNPLVKEWFYNRFREFSLTQLYGVKNIRDRKNILITAPTGGTKTLTAFLSIINYLVELAIKNELEDKIYAVYISPLKALSSDIFVNLVQPLKEIEELSQKKGLKLQDIRVGLRTGDTDAKERTRMLKKPVHILITTPETLGIVLNAPKFSQILKAVEFVIIDEIHALANKRGVFLSLCVERLVNLSNINPVRIGLSATIAPLEEIAKFLSPKEKCIIADVQFTKKTDIDVLLPVKHLINTNSQEMHSGLYDLIDRIVQDHKTVVVFTNTRSATERVVHHLKEKFPGRYADTIGAHHSSLSKHHRFQIEQGLRDGKLKVVVTSTSLELGIDIGYIDLVILLGSPKSSARALQRIGRSGHKLHDVARGRFIVLDRDDLVECCILMKECKENKIDKVQIPKNCLDVLAQHIYGMAIYKVWNADEMFNLIRQSYCYETLTKNDFFSLISYLSGGYNLENRSVYAKIWYDQETNEIGKRGKLARVIYMTNIGTIPEESFISVVISGGEKKGERIGAIDEAFLERMKPGDVFVLGGERYVFNYTRGMNIYVSQSGSRQPTIPSWFSEMLPLSFDSALEVGRFRRLLNERFDKKKRKEDIIEFVKEHLYCNDDIAEGIYEYFIHQYKFSKIPHDNRIIVEDYKGEKRYFIFHTLFGRRVNDALSRVFAFAAANTGGRDVEVGISDNGFFLSGDKINISKCIELVNPKNLDVLLKESIEKSEILKRRFRHCAARGLMILRNYKGQTRSVGKQQMRSGFILGTVKKISDEFPILKEARREVLEDVMDVNNARQVLKWIEQGRIEIVLQKTDIPSPFATNLILQGYSDLIRIEDKIMFLKRMYDEVKKRIGEED